MGSLTQINVVVVGVVAPLLLLLLLLLLFTEKTGGAAQTQTLSWCEHVSVNFSLAELYLL